MLILNHSLSSHHSVVIVAFGTFVFGNFLGHFFLNCTRNYFLLIILIFSV